MKADVRDIRLKFLINFYGKNGRPQVDITNCAVEIETLDVTLGGGAISWLLNIFHASLSKIIKQTIHNQVYCKF